MTRYYIGVGTIAVAHFFNREFDKRERAYLQVGASAKIHLSQQKSEIVPAREALKGTHLCTLAWNIGVSVYSFSMIMEPTHIILNGR